MRSFKHVYDVTTTEHLGGDQMLTKEKWRWSWFGFKTSPRLYSNTQGSASNTFLSVRVGPIGLSGAL